MTKKRRPRRGFGKIRTLPSGRLQASYVGPDMRRHTAPVGTFHARGDAEAWLAAERRLMERPDEWTPPRARRRQGAEGLTLATFAHDAIRRRRSRGEPLKPRTVELYDRLLDRLILPTFGDVPMRRIDRDAVAAWYDALGGERATQRAHAYALLKSLFAQAVDEGRVVMVNPCTIKGAGMTRRARTIEPATLAELEAAALAMPDRLRVAVLLAAWCGLRWGELSELRRKDLDLDRGTVHVERAVVRVDRAEQVGRPKSAAGVREVAIPPHLLPLLTEHLAEHVTRGREALLFPREPRGTEHWTHGHFYKEWMRAREAAGRPDLRFHDLRHTGAVLAAQTGATLAELMGRLGHSTSAAALRYQHAARGRDAQIAAALSRLAEGGTHHA